MSGIRIIAGRLKGRTIPFSNKKYGNADITPQRMKEAFFSIVGDLDGKVFLDLFSCSGQMGFEAFSRGAEMAIMIEKDRRRFQFIRDTAADLDSEGRIMIFNVAAQTGLSLIRDKQITVDIVFADPPYPKSRDRAVYESVLEMISTSGIMRPEGMAALQHQGGLEMMKELNNFSLTDERVYGSNAMSLYTCQRT